MRFVVCCALVVCVVVVLVLVVGLFAPCSAARNLQRVLHAALCDRLLGCWLPFPPCLSVSPARIAVSSVFSVFL